MSELRKATMADAKAAWEAHPKPTLRGVVAAMRENGIDMPVATLQRWCKMGFAPGEDPRRKAAKKEKIEKKTKAAEQATVQVSKAAKESEGKALTRLEVIEQEEKAMAEERTKLLEGETNTAQLADIAKRECLVAQIVLARQITRRAAVLVEIVPDIAAKALDVLVEATKTTTIIVDPTANETPSNGDGAKVVDGRLIEESSTAIALRQFQQRRRQEVAA